MKSFAYRRIDFVVTLKGGRIRRISRVFLAFVFGKRSDRSSFQCLVLPSLVPDPESEPDPEPKSAFCSFLSSISGTFVSKLSSSEPSVESLKSMSSGREPESWLGSGYLNFSS